LQHRHVEVAERLATEALGGVGPVFAVVEAAAGEEDREVTVRMELALPMPLPKSTIE
jgi:hypothetical protein